MQRKGISITVIERQPLEKKQKQVSIMQYLRYVCSLIFMPSFHTLFKAAADDNWRLKYLQFARHAVPSFLDYYLITIMVRGRCEQQFYNGQKKKIKTHTKLIDQTCVSRRSIDSFLSSTLFSFLAFLHMMQRQQLRFL